MRTGTLRRIAAEGGDRRRFAVPACCRISRNARSIDPGAGTLTYGALFALGSAVFISTVAIAIRRMSMTESTETLTLYQMSIMTPKAAPRPCP